MDGHLSSQTVFSVSKFQTDFECSNVPLADSDRNYGDFERRSLSRSLFLEGEMDNDITLEPTGRINPLNLVAMYRTLLFYTLKISSDLPCDLVLDFASVSTTIKVYQERHRLYVSGSFDEATIAKLSESSALLSE